MMNNLLHTSISLFVAVFIAACASQPKLSQEQILSQNQQIASLDKALKDVHAQGADYLAPDGYETAATQLDRAMTEAASGRSDAANTAARSGLKSLKKVSSDVERSKDLLREVLVARAKAMDAGAATLYKEDTAKLEAALRKTTSLVEQGRLVEPTHFQNPVDDLTFAFQCQLADGIVCDGNEPTVESRRRSDVESILAFKDVTALFGRRKVEETVANSALELVRPIADQEDNCSMSVDPLDRQVREAKRPPIAQERDDLPLIEHRLDLAASSLVFRACVIAFRSLHHQAADLGRLVAVCLERLLTETCLRIPSFIQVVAVADIIDHMGIGVKAFTDEVTPGSA